MTEAKLALLLQMLCVPSGCFLCAYIFLTSGGGKSSSRVSALLICSRIDCHEKRLTSDAMAGSLAVLDFVLTTRLLLRAQPESIWPWMPGMGQMGQ